MLSANEIRNTLQAVVWMYLSAEVRRKRVNRYCIGYERHVNSSHQLWCDTVGRNAFKPRPVLGGHSFHQSWVSCLV